MRLRLRMHELSDKDLARTAVAACRLCVIQPPGPMSGVLMDHSRPRHQAAHASYVPLAAVDERLLLGGKHNTRAGRAATQEDAAAVGVHPSELKVGQAFWARMAAEARRRVDMKMRPNLMAACSWALAQSSLFTAPMLDDATAALESPEQEEALQALATKTDRQDEGLGRRKRRRAATLQFQQQHAYASRPAFEETATALSMMYQGIVLRQHGMAWWVIINVCIVLPLAAHVLRHAMSWGSWSGSCYLAAEARAQPPIAAAMGVDAMYAARCAFVEREAQHAKRRSRVVREVGQVLTELGIGTVASGHHCPASGIALDFAIKDWDEVTEYNTMSRSPLTRSCGATPPRPLHSNGCLSGAWLCRHMHCNPGGHRCCPLRSVAARERRWLVKPHSGEALAQAWRCWSTTPGSFAVAVPKSH